MKNKYPGYKIFNYKIFYLLAVVYVIKVHVGHMKFIYQIPIGSTTESTTAVCQAIAIISKTVLHKNLCFYCSRI